MAFIGVSRDNRAESSTRKSFFGFRMAAPRVSLSVVVSACIFPIIYLVFVVHYVRNVFQLDDWSMAPYLNHFSWGDLWGQYREPRIVVDHVLFVADAHLGTFDLSRICIFTAILWVLSYGVLLLMFERYLQRRLTILAVLTVGAVWFSLADVQNALFAFQTGWFFVVFGLIGMMFALLIHSRRPYLWLLIGGVSAFIGTMGWIQGFVLWPLGLLCILWLRPEPRMARIRVVLWCAMFVVVAITYLIGYNRNDLACQFASRCVPESPVTHPIQAARFILVMLGNVIPGSYTSNQSGNFVNYAPQNLTRFEILGFLVLAAAAWVIVGSIRYRRSTDRLPIPLIMVLFALLVDLTVTWGRVGWVATGPILGNRYVLANLVLLTGIVMYSWAHVRPDRMQDRIWIGVLTCFLVVQLAWCTAFGIASARNTDAFLSASARVAVNVDKYRMSARACELSVYWIPRDDLAPARSSRLGEFSTAQVESYRRQGPPRNDPSVHC